MTLRAYSVRPKGEEWHVLVVAHNACEARRLAWDHSTCPLRDDLVCGWMNMRVTWLRGVPPPANAEPFVYDQCNGMEWMCPAWDADGCDGCAGAHEKREEEA